MGFPDSPDGVPSSAVDFILKDTRALHDGPTSFHTPSMLLDAEKGQPIEVEVVLGEVVRMAKKKGVSVPVSFEYCLKVYILMTSYKRIETLYALLIVVQNQILRKREAVGDHRGI